MKKLLIAFTSIIIYSTTLFADGVTEMEKWQADKIVSYLQGETYVMPFCDCCENSSYQIVQIESVSSEPTANNMYQVRLRGTTIISFSTDTVGRLINPKMSSKYVNDLLTVNYTFTAQNNKAVSLGTALGINKVGDYDVITCQQFVEIPSPKIPELASNIKYAEWYNKRIGKTDFTSIIIGSWKLISIQNRYGANVGQGNLPSWRINFKADKTYFTNIGNGESGKWFIDDSNEINTKDDETNKADRIPFNCDGNSLQMKAYTSAQGLMILNFTK